MEQIDTEEGGSLLRGFKDGGTIKFSTNNFVLNADKILASTTSYEDHVVLLKVVPFARNIGDHFTSVAESYFDAFSVGTVGLLGFSNEGF